MATTSIATTIFCTETADRRFGSRRLFEAGSHPCGKRQAGVIRCRPKSTQFISGQSHLKGLLPFALLTLHSVKVSNQFPQVKAVVMYCRWQYDEKVDVVLLFDARLLCSSGERRMIRHLPGLAGQFGTVLADPPWRFQNRTGKMAPEHRRLRRYETMTVPDICALPIGSHATPNSHLYLWVPNALLADGLTVMKAWGFEYKSNLVWYKIRKDGGPDGRGVGFYFRNVTELILFGTRGRLRTLKPGRTQVNLLATRKQEHSRKPDEFYRVIESCSPGPYLELFARFQRKGWVQWGNEIESYELRRPVVKGYTRTNEADARGSDEENVFSFAVEATG